MKKMKRFLVALLSCLTAVACVAGISACKDDKTATNDSNSSASTPSQDITINFGDSDCAHVYGVVYEIPATCDTAGRQYIGCTECGLLTGDEYVEVAALGHAITSYVEGVAPTCTEAGVIPHIKCDTCGKVSSPMSGNNEWVAVSDAMLTIPALGHDWENGVSVAGKPATCEEDGYTGYKYCPDCYAAVEAEEEFVAMAINSSADEVKAAILASGKVATLGKEVIPAAHTGFVGFVNNLAADLGLTADKTNGIVPASTTNCALNGVKDFKVCRDCEDYADKLAAAKEAVAEADVVTVEVVIAALKDAGIALDVEPEIIPTTVGHSYMTADNKSVYVQAKSATCTEDGYKAHFVCTTCAKNVTIVNGKQVVDAPIVIEALGHTIAKDDVATCTHEVKCTACGFVVEEKLDHDWVYVDDKAATCVEAGWTDKKYCADCGYMEVETLYANGHDWVAVDWEDYTEATCTTGTLVESDAGKYFICYECDVWGKMNSAGTAISDGTNHKGATISWAKPAIGHKGNAEYVAATCVDDAENYLCVNGCGAYVDKLGKVLEAEDVVAHGVHTFTGKYKVDENTSINAVAPTCTTDGVCAVCGELDNSAFGHMDADGNSTWVKKADYKAPTCTDKGNLEWYACSICKDVAAVVDGDLVTSLTVYGEVVLDFGKDNVANDNVELAAIGHDYSVEVEAKNATCQEAGYEAYTICANCGKVDGTIKTIAKRACASSNGQWCHSVCDKSYAVEWDDADEDGVCDYGTEEVYEWAGCGEIIVNNSADALHNYDEDDVCLSCGKKKN